MASEQGPYFDAIDARRKASKPTVERRTVQAPTERHWRAARFCKNTLQLACAVGIVYAFAVQAPSLRPLRSVPEEHYIFPFVPADCPIGWEAPKVDPVNLSRGMQALYEPVVAEANRYRSDGREFRSVTPEYDHRNAVSTLRSDIEQQDYLLGTTTGALDETVEVACEAPDGTYMASADMLDAIDSMQESGYHVGLMTGEVTLPPQ